ncbi:MAG: Spy/CpxP family protein refolding chaperone [Gammaproteobacteria bacterium]
MKWHNKLFGAALAAVGLLGGASVVGVSVASAQPADSPSMAPGDRGGRADRRGGGMERLLAELDLSETQLTQVQSIMEKHREATQPLREQMRSAQGREDMNSVRDQMRAAQQKLRDELSAVLTPEQRQQLEARQSEMRERMQNRQREDRGERRRPDR